MAKKKATPGKKPCPHCGALIGVRSQTCKKCNKSIPTKTKTPPKAKAGTSALDALKVEAKEIESLIADVEHLKKRLGVLNKMIEELEGLE